MSLEAQLLSMLQCLLLKLNMISDKLDAVVAAMANFDISKANFDISNRRAPSCPLATSEDIFERQGPCCATLFYLFIY